ncbi:MAG: FMN-binding protein [Tissierellia bacterium]|nr:FMN-binding protein [Tissierellia bacterium]
MKTGKKRHHRLAIFLALVLILVIVGFFIVRDIVETAVALPVDRRSLMGTPTGTYLGSFETGPVMVKVQVISDGNRITEIDILEHQQGLGMKAEEITSRIIDEQSLLVDTISGATVSSKCIIKAVEDALK